MASKLIHKKPKRVNINPLMLDPTRTKTLRRQFSQSLSGRLHMLSQRVTKLIAEENALGIGVTTGYALNTRWMFNTTSEQVSAFMKWFMEQAQELLYSQEENSWWKEYVVRAYEQGAGSAWAKWRDKSRFLQDAFNNPVQIERVKTLAGRVLTELKNVTQAMATTMSRTLTDGLAQGKSPYIVARELNQTVQGVGKTRAEMIARTETVRAHADGQLDSLEALGMDNVGVMVEWTVSGLGKTRGKGRGKVTKGGNPSPCPLCAPMKGVVMTIQQARGLLPRHPNCLCGFMPAGVGEDSTGQKLGKKAVSAALTASIKAEIPSASKRTLAEQRSRTTWAGGTKVINLKVDNFNPNHDKKGKFAVSPGDKKSLKEWSVGGDWMKPHLQSDEFSKVLDKLPKYQGEAYRGMGLSKKDIDNLKVGSIFTLSNHASFSLDQHTAEDFAGNRAYNGEGLKAVVLKIKNLEGNEISEYAHKEHSYQREVVAKLGTSYVVDKVYKSKIKEMGGYEHNGLIIELSKIPTANFNPNHDKEGKFAHAQSATHDFLKSMEAILQTSAKAHADHVYVKMAEVEIGVDRGALVAVRDLRKVSGLSKNQFDQAVYDLVKEARVSAHRHDFAASLPPHELAELVDTSIGDPSRADLPANHGRYWVGIARKQK